MSAFEPARPRYTLPFAGKDYELLGTFALIEAVEYAMKEYVGVVAVQITHGMPSTSLAKLISTILTACGHKVTAQQAGVALWESVGLTGDENDALRLHLYSFLRICLAPPGMREKKAQDMGKLMGEPNTDDSPGSTTAGPASAS